MCTVCMDRWYFKTVTKKCEHCGYLKNSFQKMYTKMEYIRENTKIAKQTFESHIDEDFLNDLLRVGIAGLDAVDFLYEAANKEFFGGFLDIVPAHLLAVKVFTKKDLTHLFTNFQDSTRCSNPNCLSTIVTNWTPEKGHFPALFQEPDIIPACLLCTLFEAEILVQKWLVEGVVYVDPPQHPGEFVFSVNFSKDTGLIPVQLDKRDNFLICVKGKVGALRPTFYYPHRQCLDKLFWQDSSNVVFTAGCQPS